ncbi:MAG: NTP transferase domain-containing protein [Candidatus Cloacimonetes bacterium]|nr:NTP transferase domain-containing protein [Candidatus Cloacimonadota bacterium]
MHIIIPMSGTGNRFIIGGYNTPKPLIKIDGKAMIEHVVNLFPKETKFTFICNSQHLQNTDMKEILTQVTKDPQIVEIDAHKLGPVYAVSKVFEMIDDNEEVIVNYCDFGTYWDYQDFLNHTRHRNADGAVVSYKGFHPHMLGSTNYAFMRDQHQWMLEIKEKESFTNDRMQEYASNGTYYFKNGSLVKKYFQKLIDLNLNLNGEFYVSLVYNLLIQDKLNVSIYEIQHMLQWGTPEDVKDYNHWSKYFKDAVSNPNNSHKIRGTCIVPLAGLGQRFIDYGYKTPKPLLDINSKPMIIQATNSLPKTDSNVFVCLKDHTSSYPIEKILTDTYPKSKIYQLDKPSQGQAISCFEGLTHINFDEPLIVGATDNAIVYDYKQLDHLINDTSVDAIIWTFKNHPTVNKNPQMYGWVETTDDLATNISVKKAISDQPSSDHAITGIFYFKKAQYYKDGLELLLHKNNKVNNEYYIDSLMNELIHLGLNVKVFEVQHYVCWGTPEDYETYKYWQSYFHKCLDHAYTLELDANVDQKVAPIMAQQFFDFHQTY